MFLLLWSDAGLNHVIWGQHNIEISKAMDGSSRFLQIHVISGNWNSKIVSGLQVPRGDTVVSGQNVSSPKRHVLVRIGQGTNRKCQFCSIIGIKTACNIVRSYYKCEACDVFLCRPNVRDCFRQYHAYLALQSQINASKQHKVTQSQIDALKQHK